MMATKEMERIPITDPSIDPKGSAAIFLADGDGVKALNTPSSMGALTHTRIATKDIRTMADQFIREMVSDRAAAINAAATIDKEMGRRIEVAVKAAMPRLEREVENAIKVAVTARVGQIVGAMDIRVSVSITGG